LASAVENLGVMPAKAGIQLGTVPNARKLDPSFRWGDGEKRACSRIELRRGMTSLLPFLAARGCGVPAVDLLQPADPFLDAAGEDLRRRIFLTADANGAALCLRPEFTIPVCRHHLAAGRGQADWSARYAYEGTVFRQRKDEPAEFRQAGIEDLGHADAAAADARSLGDCLAALGELGVRDCAVLIGDQAVFEAVLSGLELPPAWRKRLTRAFGDSAKLRADVARLSGEAPEKDALPAEARQFLDSGDRDGLESWIAGQMAVAGLPQTQGRAADEIAARLAEKAELAAARLDAAHRRALEAFLAIDVEFAESIGALEKLAADHGFGCNGELTGALADFARRSAAIGNHSRANLRFRARFGRSLDYYSGLVFEVAANGVAKPLAGGGRYDRLLQLLGAPAPVPAVGFSIWLDRAQKAAGGSS
jgi:ATP phosphoribosyltransferase regulatory subunit